MMHSYPGFQQVSCLFTCLTVEICQKHFGWKKQDIGFEMLSGFADGPRCPPVWTKQ